MGVTGVCVRQRRREGLEQGPARRRWGASTRWGATRPVQGEVAGDGRARMTPRASRGVSPVRGRSTVVVRGRQDGRGEREVEGGSSRWGVGSRAVVLGAVVGDDDEERRRPARSSSSGVAMRRRGGRPVVKLRAPASVRWRWLATASARGDGRWRGPVRGRPWHGREGGGFVAGGRRDWRWGDGAPRGEDGRRAGVADSGGGRRAG